MLTRFEDIENKDGFYVFHTVIGGAGLGNYGVIFTALNPCELMAAVESHQTAGSDAGTVTLQLERLTTGEALDAGDTMLVTAWNLKSTADTPVTREGSQLQNRQLAPGDRIALKDAGTLTGVAGVQATLYLKRLGKGDYR